MLKTATSKFQEQFWLLNNLAKKSPAYNIPSVFETDTIPNIQVLEEALNILINRHDSLRTHFLIDNDVIVQAVKPAGSLKIEVETINLSSELPENGNLPPEVIREVHEPFDLTSSPLLRVKVFKGEDKNYLSIVFHHIIVDLHSKNIFANELAKLYNAKLNGKNIRLSDDTGQYPAFSDWHNGWLKSSQSENMIAKWVKELPSANTLTNLPTDYPRTKYVSLNGKRKYFRIDKPLAGAIHEYALHNASYSFVIMLTAYAILLNRLTQQNIIVIGVPLSNRRSDEFKDTFGCFVNIVPIVVDFSNNPTVGEVRKQIRQKMLLAHRKQEVPFLSLLDSNKEKRNPSYNPYFQTAFTFEHPMDLQLDNVNSKWVPIEKEGSQLDIFLTLWEKSGEFHGYIEYSSELFNQASIERFKECYVTTIEELITEDKPTNQISVLTDSDKDLLKEWNNTDYPVNTDICLHRKFEEHVNKFPENIALKTDTVTLSYREFNAHANRLAHHLIHSGVKTEDIVAVCMNRSVELLIAIYAIHKAGAAYLPLSPDYPEERLDMILEDAKPRFILTRFDSSENISKYGNRIMLDNIMETPLSDNAENPITNVTSSNLAYVIYTSGSTGKPKGVMIEHRSVINKLEWMQYKYPTDHTDTLMLKTPVTFDVSVWELFWWFFNGASLAILPHDGEKNPLTIIKTAETHKVTNIIFVPSMLSPFVEYVHINNYSTRLASLKHVVLIGEALSNQLVTSFNNLRNNTFNPLLINTYGPTEATVAVSYFDCPKSNPVKKVYIGKPIFNTKLFIINGNNKVQPIGVPGELVIAGENLSRGYLNRPDLNKERFINIKGIDNEDILVYRTGDLVKWSDNGELDFIGRIDNQVKVRGYRIELGDIEAKLLEHELVKTAAVIVSSLGKEDKQLVGYAVLKDGENSTPIEIKKFLHSKLPDYMVPSHILILGSMPLNTSGKIDRKSLPVPTIETSEELIKPTSNIEKALSQIWSKLLDHEKIGVMNNFFEIGGNSITAIRMVGLIKEQLGVSIEPITLMQYPNIRELASFINSQNGVKMKDTYTPRTNARKRNFQKVRKRME